MTGTEADLDEGNPGQDGRDKQQSGGDEFGQTRARRRRLDGVMIVVAMIVMTMVGVRRFVMGGVAVSVARGKR